MHVRLNDVVICLAQDWEPPLAFGGASRGRHRLGTPHPASRAAPIGTSSSRAPPIGALASRAAPLGTSSSRAAPLGALASRAAPLGRAMRKKARRRGHSDEAQEGRLRRGRIYHIQTRIIQLCGTDILSTFESCVTWRGKDPWDITDAHCGAWHIWACKVRLFRRGCACDVRRRFYRQVGYRTPGSIGRLGIEQWVL